MAKKQGRDDGAVELWAGITDNDFYEEDNIVDIDMVEFDLEKWGIFTANVNYFRQFPRLSDSLKPVQRRILITMYSMGLLPGKHVKSANVAGKTMEIHGHGDGTIYRTMIGMTAPWKMSVPLIDGVGNFGNDAHPELAAASRYTEVMLSKYAHECFFQDYDPDCVETIFNSSSDKPEPISLPAKFPNILINGGIGFAPGNAYCIPPFNVNDVIEVTKKLVANPSYTKIMMVPDFPTGCDIVADTSDIAKICELGKGSVRMRANIEIIDHGKDWILKITSLPWLTSLSSIDEKIVELARANKLRIKDTGDFSTPVKLRDGTLRTRIDYRITIDKSYDPYAFREKLYKMTTLEKSFPVIYKSVTDDLKMQTKSLRELILSWIDERRSYKRRLYNKRLNKISARISLLDKLIYLFDGANLNKTLAVIRGNSSSETTKKLIELCDMTSYQAVKIAALPISTFTKDARERFIEERDELRIEKDRVIELMTSEKAIDELIIDELDDLKKYARPRLSNLVTPDGHQTVSDTDHTLIVTKQGYIKKHGYDPTKPGSFENMGTFRDLDYPIFRRIVNNMDGLLFFDSYGRYTNIPVHEIGNTEPSNPGSRIYDIMKLNGEIVTVMPEFRTLQQQVIKDKLNRKTYLVTLTKNGFIKKTQIDEYLDVKSSRNIRAMKIRDDDQLIYAGILVDGVDLMIYTKNGYYSLLNLDQVSEQSKDSMGVIGIKLKDMDQCVGLSVIGSQDKFIMVLTAKGNMKKCELEFFGENGKRGGSSSYLTTLDKNDEVVYANGISNKAVATIATRLQIHVYDVDEIPTLTRKAKCVKKVSIPVGCNIISTTISPRVKK